jgi:hypothetical protein
MVRATGLDHERHVHCFRERKGFFELSKHPMGWNGDLQDIAYKTHRSFSKNQKQMKSISRQPGDILSGGISWGGTD